MISAVVSFFLSPLGRWVAGALLIAALLGGIYTKGYSDGKQNVQSKWDAAVQAAIQRGTNARTEAERDIEPQPSPGSLSDDKFNRD